MNKTIKEGMVEAANVLGGKKGAVGVFEQTGAKDIVAFANMLTQLAQNRRPTIIESMA